MYSGNNVSATRLITSVNKDSYLVCISIDDNCEMCEHLTVDKEKEIFREDILCLHCTHRKKNDCEKEYV